MYFPFLANFSKKLARVLLDTLFPKICLFCKREGTHLCEDCAAFIPLNNVVTKSLRPSSLSGIFSATSYQDSNVERIIQFFKYPPFLKDLARPLASLIVAYLVLLDKAPLFLSPEKRHEYALCPIPLHPRRTRWRGFNQAQEIARELSKLLTIPLLENVLIKTKHTAPQVELKGEWRKRNVLDVFQICNKQKVANKKILLVDDIFTTGATMKEAATVLKKSGANQVWGIVIAKG